MSEHAAMSGIRATAVVDLLGMLAFAELLAFDRMAVDARLAPDLRRRAILSEMAGREIANYCRFADRLTELGVDPETAMAPFVAPLQDYHGQTEPGDWFEGLTKAYVGDSVADDFTREVAGLLDAPDRDLILDVLHDSRHADFAAAELRASIAADPKLANRLSMWARRLVGEGLSQALRVAAERPALAALLMASAEAESSATSGPAERAGSGLAERAGSGPAEGVGGDGATGGIQGLLRRLTAAHTARMAAVGLNN